MEKALKEMIKCPLCLEEATDPRMLQCQHTYCVACLKKYIASRPSPHTSVPCPVCRNNCTIPNGDAMKLPKNIFHKTLFDIITRGGFTASEDYRAEDQQKRFCDVGGCNEKAKKFCHSDCGYLCRKHYKDHRSAASTRHHHVVPAAPGKIDRLSSQETFPSCEIHPHEVLDLLCKTCDIPVCTTCVTMKHQQHRYCELKDVAEWYRDQLQHTVIRVGSMIKCIKKAMEATDKQSEIVKRDIAGLRREVTATFEQVIMKLKQERKLILHQLDKAELETMKTREEVKDCQETMLAKLESVEFYAKGLLSSEKVYNYVTNLKKLNTSLNEHTKSRLPEFMFDTQVAKTAKVQFPQMSKVQFSHIRPADHSYVDQSNPGQACTSRQPPPGVTLRRLRTQHQNREVSGLAAWAGCVFVVHGVCNTLYVYREGSFMTTSEDPEGLQGGLVTSTRIPGMMCPVGLCALGTERDNITLCISDMNTLYSDYGKLHWVKVSLAGEGLAVRHIKHDDLSYMPYGLCADDTSHTVIVTDRDHHCLHQYDSKGRVIKTVTMTIDIRPDNAAPDRAGGYVVCDSDNKQLVWLKRDGTVTKMLKKTDSRCKFVYPFHVTTDHQARMVLADYEGHAILLFSADGSYMYRLVTRHDNITSPTRVTLTPCQDRLWVSHGEQGSRDLVCFDYHALTGASSTTPLTPASADGTPRLGHDDYVPFHTSAFNRAVDKITIGLTLPQM